MYHRCVFATKFQHLLSERRSLSDSKCWNLVVKTLYAFSIHSDVSNNYFLHGCAWKNLYLTFFFQTTFFKLFQFFLNIFHWKKICVFDLFKHPHPQRSLFAILRTGMSFFVHFFPAYVNFYHFFQLFLSIFVNFYQFLSILSTFVNFYKHLLVFVNSCQFLCVWDTDASLM